MTVQHRDWRMRITQYRLLQTQLENAFSQETKQIVAPLFGVELEDEETL